MHPSTNISTFEIQQIRDTNLCAQKSRDLFREEIYFSRILYLIFCITLIEEYLLFLIFSIHLRIFLTLRK